MKVTTELKETTEGNALNMQDSDISIIVDEGRMPESMRGAVIIKHWKGFVAFVNDNSTLPCPVRFWLTEDFPPNVIVRRFTKGESITLTAE